MFSADLECSVLLIQALVRFLVMSDFGGRTRTYLKKIHSGRISKSCLARGRIRYIGMTQHYALDFGNYSTFYE